MSGDELAREVIEAAKAWFREEDRSKGRLYDAVFALNATSRSLPPPPGHVDERVRDMVKRLRAPMWKVEPVDIRNLASEAADLLEFTDARLVEAAKQLAEADAVICAADAPPLGWWDDQQDRSAIERASERHAARASRAETGETR